MNYNGKTYTYKREIRKENRMKKVKKVLLVMLMFCILFSQCMTVQAADVKGAKKAKYTISINKSVYTMKKGKKVTLKASLNPAAKKKA